MRDKIDAGDTTEAVEYSQLVASPGCLVAEKWYAGRWNHKDVGSCKRLAEIEEKDIDSRAGPALPEHPLAVQEERGQQSMEAGLSRAEWAEKWIARSGHPMPGEAGTRKVKLYHDENYWPEQTRDDGCQRSGEVQEIRRCWESHGGNAREAALGCQ